MGGKGGGGGEDPTAAINRVYDTTSHPGYFIDRSTGVVRDSSSRILANSAAEMWPDTSAADKAAADKAAADKAASDKAAADKAAADKVVADKAAADKAAADAAAVAAAPKATTNLATPDTPSVTKTGAAPVAPIGTPIETGTPLGTPAPATETGDLLGGAVLKPPKYWVGGLDAQTSDSLGGRGRGALRTTQT
jgi:hypothetical protein